MFRNYERNGCGAPGLEGQAFSPASCIVTNAGNGCISVAVAIPRNIRIILYALPIVKSNCLGPREAGEALNRQ